MPTHEIFDLAVFQDRIILGSKQSYISGEKIALLEISRPTCEFIVRHDVMPLSGYERYITMCYGIFGVINLLAGPYLIIITGRDLVGDVHNHQIWRITTHEIIPVFHSARSLSSKQSEFNSRYLSMVRNVLSSPGFYYSPSLDITHSIQRVYCFPRGSSSLSLFARADARFLWNHFLLKDLSEVEGADDFCIPIILGFVAIKQCHIKSRSFKLMLISRRSSQRVGVRYYTRGLDGEGNAANYVETEQILLLETIQSSFVQTRGSVPLLWSQAPNLRYKPSPVLGLDNQTVGFSKHFAEQISTYNQQHVINLLDNKGYEKMLSDNYKMQVDDCGLAISYIHFDFHKECSKLRWHNLYKLMDMLERKQEEMGYFFQAGNSTNATLQHGTFRTNCIDCLDRTNVVQSMLARRSLLTVLHSVNVLQEGERLDLHPEFEFVFKNMWADHADVLAIQYTGTKALKTDYTRTGKRSLPGMLRDGYNSCIRYVYNNFNDGFRQDSLDLFVGNYQVRPAEGSVSNPSPFDTKLSYTQILAPTSLIILSSLLFITLILPSTNTSLQLAYVLFWGLGVSVSLLYILSNGKQFVNKPVLYRKD
ncbi:phosphatidylinositol-3-phosphatase SAC1 [Oopsacas minuta]|uniref:Phosphatidylinositol-3-phosphatase SAC1 n=1 Tax=Oopsacas minuta TaxID=111878 RepID=A0AAV7JAZ4_9METZ|nr:phosphatidylinositol-3-phosphatase SAC1 [Oopsacas minuta]